MSDDSALLAGIFAAAVDAIIVCDSRSTITHANRAAEQLFGYEARELLGQSITRLMPSEVAATHENYMAHHIKTGEKRVIGIGREEEAQRKDGSCFPVHLSVGRTYVEGELLFISIMHDLTERKATELALSRSQRLDAIGQMTGGITHDFNNLLTVIMGNLELLEMRITEPRHLALIKDALEATELGAELTSRLTMFSGQTKLKPAKTDLNTACDESLALLKRSLGERYAIETSFAANIPSILVDPTQLHTALANLVLNAKDAMPKGGTLKLETQMVTLNETHKAQNADIQPGLYVRLLVSDTGEGMTDETQRRAFDPFYTTKDSLHGTGLGLAMVYGFIRQSGGHISLHSQLGIGTVFALCFPAISQADDDSTHMTNTAVSKGAGQTILVTEDNAQVRKLSVQRIRELGYNVLEATNGDTAFAMLKSGVRVDLVFSDILMPGDLDGLSLARKVQDEFPTVKILLTSGHAMGASDPATGNLESFNILHKPYKHHALAARLQQVLSAK